MKEEWEVACTKAPPPKPVKQVSVVVEPTNSETEPQDSDSYCFELLSMLIGLSQSEVGCNFLSEQNKLVHDLLTLLHVASLRIQLQASSVLCVVTSFVCYVKLCKVLVCGSCVYTVH